MIRALVFSITCLLCAGTPLAAQPGADGADLQSSPVPPQRPAREQPTARWDDAAGGGRFTQATIDALKAHGAQLAQTVPSDIAAWCPAYASSGPRGRRAFWVGMISAIAWYESRYQPDVVGGSGRYYGLMQISPATARSVGCRAGSGEALKSGSANLACTVRILAHVVPRHGVISARTSGWRGISNQWGPLRREGVRNDIKSWLSQQSYCQRNIAPVTSPRPVARPAP